METRQYDLRTHLNLEGIRWIFYHLNRLKYAKEQRDFIKNHARVEA